MIVRFALFTSNGEAAAPGQCDELPMSIAVLRVKKKIKNKKIYFKNTVNNSNHTP